VSTQEARSDSGVEQLIATATASRIIDLEQPRFAGMPMFPANAPNYSFMLHRRHERGLERRTSAAGMILAADHSGTHIDALCHQAEDMRMFGGVEVSTANQQPGGMNVLTAETIPPIVRRGVLLDLTRRRGGRLPPSTLVDAAELESVAAAQGTTIKAGDVLLIRTGWGAAWKEDAYLTGAGMHRSAAEWVAEKHVFAVGADNMSWDLPGYVDDDLGHSLPCHTILLVRSGIYLVENLYLEELGEASAYEFVFISLPLKLVGATGSPTRPVALIPAVNA
jgi:kynurenine formamidase